MSKFYVVSTPIGNLEDITIRALKALEEVAVIACEDTRRTKILLDTYNIKKRLIATHAHNEGASAGGIVKLLQESSSVAYVSDAGTPGISDPGAKVVAAVRAAGFPVIPIPGVSAVTTLSAVAGSTQKSFTFEGFLSPRKGRRTKRLGELLGRIEPFVLYESPFRVLTLLGEIAQLAPTRRVIIGREMTKLHEEFIEGTVSEVAELLAQREVIKGEFALFIYGAEATEDD